MHLGFQSHFGFFGFKLFNPMQAWEIEIHCLSYYNQLKKKKSQLTEKFEFNLKMILS